MKLFQSNTSLFIAAMLAAMHPCSAIAGETPSCAGKPVVEIVVFSSNKGVSDSAMKRAAVNVTPILRNMPGFKDRIFSKSSNGKWVDVVQWQSLESANAAAEKVMKNSVAATFFGLINQNDMSIKHLCE